MKMCPTVNDREERNERRQDKMQQETTWRRPGHSFRYFLYIARSFTLSEILGEYTFESNIVSLFDVMVNVFFKAHSLKACSHCVFFWLRLRFIFQN